MERRTVLDLKALGIGPEGEKKALERRISASDFFQNILLPGIKAGEIKKRDDVYEALREYRQSQKADINILHVLGPVHDQMLLAMRKCRSGQVPLDFFEIDAAFTLVTDAITKSDQYFQEPDCNQSELTREVYRIFRGAVLKFVHNVGLKKRLIGLQGQ